MMELLWQEGNKEDRVGEKRMMDKQPLAGVGEVEGN